ncbi:MAG: aminoglycoside phosphotransferase family protein [Dehalococcoidia bacterium]
MSAAVAHPPIEAVAGLLDEAEITGPFTIEPLPGGRNNRVFRLDTSAGPVLLKAYFRHPGDPRDRLGAEWAFTRFAWGHGIRRTPRPLAASPEHQLALYQFVEGRHLSPGEVSEAHVQEAMAFIIELNAHRESADANDLPAGSEAAFTLNGHLAAVDRRIARLAAIEPASPLHAEALAFIHQQLSPSWQDGPCRRPEAQRSSERIALDTPLVGDRLISPSDFGFHNALLADDGLVFLDFEYAGWDDPAKLVCDFFCQPARPAPPSVLPAAAGTIAALTTDPAAALARIDLLLPVYQVKWCSIMLNEFLPIDNARRQFASATGADAAAAQLEIVRGRLATLGGLVSVLNKEMDR